MITDHISNATLYFGLGERIKTALQYLSETDFSKVESGEYALDGKNVYAMVVECTTKSVDESLLEAHKNYIDIHFMIEGEECIGYEWLNNQEISEPYHEKEDYWLFIGNPDMIRYTKGMFAIMYPQDLHMPKVISGKSMPIRKVIVKVKV